MEETSKKVRQREIKDYLHLYLWQTFRYTGKGKPFRGTSINEVLKPSNLDLLSISNDRKLMLRPLSDMTDEDYKAIGGHGFGGASTKELWLDQFEQFEERPAFGQGKKSEVKNPKMVKNKVREGLQLKHYTFAPDAFRYLLSKGFDLFGLIEEGLAIDKTKLQGEIKTELI